MRASFCKNCKQLGDRNPMWNSTYSREDREHLRITEEYVNWAKNIKIRDLFTCQKCKVIGGTLHSHHIESFAKNKKLRYDLDNGITLCKKCHNDFHNHYGKITNLDQLDDFLD
jgi:5-methylcytosine-specific restriction endonuclease McrA